MSTRTVTYNLQDLTGTAMKGAKVEVHFTGTYTPGSQVLAGQVESISDDDGNGSFELFVNETGEVASSNICYLPDGTKFAFTVPSGAFAISLSELRQLGAEEGTRQYNTIATYINSLIQSGEIPQFVDVSNKVDRAEISPNVYNSLPDVNTLVNGQIIFVNDPL